MNSIEFIRGQGGVPKTLPGLDHYSGFLMYVAESLDFGTQNTIQAISSIETAESLGIKADSPHWHVKALHYHLSEIFRINPAIVLWVGVYDQAITPTFSEVRAIQNHAGGDIRQLAVYTPDMDLSAATLTTLQGVARRLETEDQPLSILYAANVANATTLLEMTTIGTKNISVVISQDGSGVAQDLYQETQKSVTTIGNALGLLSTAAVHESIAWVQRFPSGVNVPALADGTLIKSIDKTVITGLDDKQYLFLVTFASLAGSFYNDSWTMDEATSDYCKIESVRTMDKAIRGIRTYLLPYLGGPLRVDASTGKLSPDTMAYIQLLAGKQLEEMEKTGELSGYTVEIDPAQNVLASSSLEVVIKQVAIGVMRRVKIKIGFTTKL